METKKDPLDLATDWLLSSGIQSKAGGFHSWYDLEKKDHSYLYSEITGYGITALLFLSELLKDKKIIKKAEKAAEWIERIAIHPCGGVRTRLYKEDSRADAAYSFSGARIFSFDTGMVLYGLISLYKVTNKKRHLDIATKLGDFIIDKMQNSDGSLSPIYDANIEELIEPCDKWSSQSGAFGAKVSMGITDLYRVTKKEKYKEASLKLCNHAISLQDKSGRFITDRLSGSTHVHPHSYAAEGLWYTGTCLDEDKFIRSARGATEWIFNHLASSGINELYSPIENSFNDFMRTDILAQSMRLGIIFSIKEKIEKLKDLLMGYQYTSGGQRGGFLYSVDDKHLNSWCSMFALQALALYKNKSILKSKNLFLLI